MQSVKREKKHTVTIFLVHTIEEYVWPFLWVYKNSSVVNRPAHSKNLKVVHGGTSTNNLII